AGRGGASGRRSSGNPRWERAPSSTPGGGAARQRGATSPSRDSVVGLQTSEARPTIAALRLVVGRIEEVGSGREAPRQDPAWGHAYEEARAGGQRARSQRATARAPSQGGSPADLLQPARARAQDGQTAGADSLSRRLLRLQRQPGRA